MVHKGQFRTQSWVMTMLIICFDMNTLTEITTIHFSLVIYKTLRVSAKKTHSHKRANKRRSTDGHTKCLLQATQFQCGALAILNIEEDIYDLFPGWNTRFNVVTST